MKAMQGWFCVWSRKLDSTEPLDGLDLYDAVAEHWYDRANKGAVGAVFERKRYDEEGAETAEVYAFLRELVGDKDDAVVVFSSEDLAQLEAVADFWKGRVAAMGEQAKEQPDEAVRLYGGAVLVSRWLVEAHRFYGGAVLASRWLVEAHRFEESVHRLDRN